MQSTLYPLKLNNTIRRPTRPSLTSTQSLANIKLQYPCLIICFCCLHKRLTGFDIEYIALNDEPVQFLIPKSDSAVEDREDLAKVDEGHLGWQVEEVEPVEAAG